MTRNLTIARQMIAADLLRLRKKRGFIALVMVVVLAPLVIATGYNVVQHASDPAAHGPAGGLHYYTRLLEMLGVFMGPVAAILIGAEAGAAEISARACSGTTCYRTLPHRAVLARIPAALAVCLTVTALGFAIGLAVTFGFAGGLPTPSATLILESVAWLALANSVCA